MKELGKDQEEIYQAVKRLIPTNLKNLDTDKLKAQIQKVGKPFNHSYSLVLIKYFERAIANGDPNIKEQFEKLLYEEIKNERSVLVLFTMKLEGVIDLIESEFTNTPFGIWGLVSHYSSYEDHLILSGETGTSKGLIAKVIHKVSMRRGGPFNSVNCAALPEHLLESELFGYEKGAFTGANFAKEGLLKLTDKGVFLLDELGKMPPHLQVKLLRVIDEKKVRPIGGKKETPVDIRFIATTHPSEISSICPDLLYRLGYPDIIKVPSLKERIAVAPTTIIQSSINEARKAMGINESITIDKNAIGILIGHQQYKGNFRELQNILRGAIKSALRAGRTQVQPSDLHLLEPNKANHDTDVPSSTAPAIERCALFDVKLSDIIDHAESIKKLIITEKVKEVVERGDDIRSVLQKEGLPARQYGSYYKKLTQYAGKIRELKKL